MPAHKQFIVALVTLPFLTVALFGFATMTVGPDAMPGDCPFSALGAPLCPDNAVVMALHHVAAYHSFLNVPIALGLLGLLLAMLSLAILLILLRAPPLPRYRPPPYFYDSPPSVVRIRLLRWLARFELSPSVT